MIAVYRRELNSLMKNMTGWLFIALMLIVVSIYVYMLNLTMMYPNFEYAIQSGSFIYLLIIPVITMRSVAEEFRQKTDKLLYALPLRTSGVAAGKYFAVVTVLIVPMAIFCLVPQILSLYGDVRFAPAYATICGFFLLGAALSALGIFISSLTDNSVVAAAASFGVMLLTYLMSDLSAMVPSTASASFLAFLFLAAVISIVIYVFAKNIYLSALVILLSGATLAAFRLLKPIYLEGAFSRVMTAISLFARLKLFSSGVFDITAVVYYLSLSFVFLVLTWQSLEYRRWKR